MSGVKVEETPDGAHVHRGREDDEAAVCCIAHASMRRWEVLLMWAPCPYSRSSPGRSRLADLGVRAVEVPVEVQIRGNSKRACPGDSWTVPPEKSLILTLDSKLTILSPRPLVPRTRL